MPLLTRITTYSAKPALAGAWGVVTYAELGALVGKAQQSLAQLKLDRPTAFGLIGEHGPASTAWLIALAEAGHFVAPLSGNAAEHPAKLALINAQWIVATGDLTWELLPRVDEPSAHPLFAQLREQGSAGLVLFSSGTSGTPKAMVQHFTTLLATYETRHPSRLPLLALLGFDHIGGYLNSTNEAFMADGWFRTGDKVESGPDGTLRISGRVGETINVCGEKLMPQEVEAVILDIVAAGNPDFEGLRAKIRTVCRAKLARHKVPTWVNFVSRVSGERLKKIRIKKQTTGKPTI